MCCLLIVITISVDSSRAGFLPVETIQITSCYVGDDARRWSYSTQKQRINTFTVFIRFSVYMWLILSKSFGYKDTPSTYVFGSAENKTKTIRLPLQIFVEIMKIFSKWLLFTIWVIHYLIKMLKFYHIIIIFVYFLFKRASQYNKN